MPKFIIERELPGAGKLSQEELVSISQTSCKVISSMGPDIQWLESYVTEDKIYCIYLAAHPDLLKQHASEGGFPANVISQVKNEISPLTAELQVQMV